MNEKTRIQWRYIGDVRPYPNNPRNNDEAVEYVANSLREFGWQQPIVVDNDGTIIAGHTRLKAAKLLGMETVPVVVADNLTPAQVNAYRLADNKVAEAATWDMEALAVELEGLEVDFDMSMFDFEASEFDFGGLGGEQTDIVEDEVPDDAPSIVQKGDVWQLGRHRLMCGDSTYPESVEKLMDGEKADMVFTDPPYGVNVKGGKGKGNLIMGDLTQTAIPFSFEIAVEKCTKEKAHFYFCGGEGNIQMYQKLFDRYLHMLPKHLIWVKNGFVMKQNGYHNQFEIIYHGYKQGSGGLWYGGRTEDEASDVWHINRDPSSTYLHPTQKPVGIPARAVRNSCPPDGSVVDLFGGSGSTLIAAEQLGRTCYMMELDPHYCDIIIERWQNLTGETARKVKADGQASERPL